MVRLFVAIDLPAAVKHRLGGLCAGLPGARWVAPEQLHLTLRFIGEVDNEVFADVAEVLATANVAPFPLRLSGVGHFPPRGAPKVLWAGVEDGDSAARLNRTIEARLRGLGLPPDRRKFSPHVTLARLKATPIGRVRDYLAVNGPFATEDFPVSEFHLYSSKLGAKGAIHRIEASYDLEHCPVNFTQ